MKRFQECNWLEKIWRYRWYIAMVFVYGWRRVNTIKIYKDEIVNNQLVHTNEYENPNSKMLWRLCKGEAQSKMNWTITMEEMKEKSEKWFKEKKTERRKEICDSFLKEK